MNMTLSPAQSPASRSSNKAVPSDTPKTRDLLGRRKLGNQQLVSEEQQASQTSADTADLAAAEKSAEMTTAPAADAGEGAVGSEAAQGVAGSVEAGQAVVVGANSSAVMGGVSTLSIAGGLAAAVGGVAVAGAGGSSGQSSPAPAGGDAGKDVPLAPPVVYLPGDGSGKGVGTPSDPILVNAHGSIQIGIQPGSDWRYSTDGGVTWRPGTAEGIVAGDLQEGANIVQIVQKDQAGHSSAPTTITVVKDTTAPVAPALDLTHSGTGAQTGAVVGTGTSADPIIIGSDGKVSVATESNADWSFSTDGGVTWHPGSGVGISAKDLTEGTHTIQIVQKDQAGNTSAPTTITVVKDTTAPLAPALDVTQSSTGAQAGAVLGSGTADDPILISAGGKVSIATESNADWRYSTDGITWHPGTSAGLSSNDLQEGINSIQIVQIDKAGNVSAVTPLTVVKDTVAPAASQLVVLGDLQSGISGSGSIAIGQLESGATWEYSLDGGQTWIHGQNASIDASVLAKGVNHIDVVQIDAAGNRGVVSSLDVFKPAALQLTAAAGVSDTVDGRFFGLNTPETFDVGGLNLIDISASTFTMWLKGQSVEASVLYTYPLSSTEMEVLVGKQWFGYSSDTTEWWDCVRLRLTEAADGSVTVKMLSETGYVLDIGADWGTGLFAFENQRYTSSATSGGIGLTGVKLSTRDNVLHIDATEQGSGWQYSTDDGATWTTGHGAWLALDQLPGASTIRLAPLDAEGVRGQVTIFNRDGSEVVAPAAASMFGLMSPLDTLLGGSEVLPIDLDNGITSMPTDGLHGPALQAQGAYLVEPTHTGSVIPV